MTCRRLFKSLDYPIMLTVLTIVLFSFIVIGSATLEFTDESFSQLQNMNIIIRLLHLDYTYLIKQCIWFLMGILIMMLIIYVPYEDLAKYSRTLYILSLLMLIAVLFTGDPTFGAQRWIQLGMFTFQPSEFSKLIIIITFANFLVNREGKLNRFRDLLPCFLHVGLPVLLILKQPDLGTSLVFIVVMFAMLFFAGARPSLVVGLIVACIFLVVSLFLTHMYLHNADVNLEQKLVYLEKVGDSDAQRKYKELLEQYRVIRERHEKFHKYTLKEYQMTRLLVFINPQGDVLGAGYHVWQSLIAIGSGGFLGKGLLGGTQSHLTFLPVRHTDFIFSVVGEEFGFLGTLFLLGLFFILLYRGIQIAAQAHDFLGTLLAVGIVSMFAFHILLNVGMTSGIMPVTGIPLPFFSYGGSNMLMNMASLGLLLNIYARRRKLLF